MQLEADEIESSAATEIIKEYFKENSELLWEDALKEHELIWALCVIVSFLTLTKSSRWPGYYFAEQAESILSTVLGALGMLP